MSDESQLQVSKKDGDSSLILSSARSSLVARGRQDAALLAVPCNKCGERKELVFAGRVCANCSDALDREWAASTATDWLVTRPTNSSVGDQVLDFILLNTTYAWMKTYAWAAWGYEWFGRFRQATPEEIAHLISQWGTWCDASGARAIRPATPEEVAAEKQKIREWSIATETDQILLETCERLGIAEQDDPPEQAAEEIARRLRELGWIEELVKMKREDCDAFRAMDGGRVLEAVLRKSGNQGR